MDWKFLYEEKPEKLIYACSNCGRTISIKYQDLSGHKSFPAICPKCRLPYKFAYKKSLKIAVDVK